MISPLSCRRATDRTRPSLLLAILLAGVPHPAVADGKSQYRGTCIACHGPSARGAISGVPDMAEGGRLAKPGAVLVANILNGFQSQGSAMAMPAKGGNLNLTAEDVQALVLYMRTLTGSSD